MGLTEGEGWCRMVSGYWLLRSQGGMIVSAIRALPADIAEEVENEMFGIVPDLPPSVFRRRFISAYKPLAAG